MLYTAYSSYERRRTLLLRKKQKSTIDIEGLSRQLVEDDDGVVNLQAVQHIVNFLVCTGRIDDAKKLIALFKETPCYNCAADVYICALLSADLEGEKLALARKEARRLQRDITADLEYACHPSAGLFITIACFTENSKDIRKSARRNFEGRKQSPQSSGSSGNPQTHQKYRGSSIHSTDNSAHAQWFRRTRERTRPSDKNNGRFASVPRLS